MLTLPAQVKPLPQERMKGTSIGKNLSMNSIYNKYRTLTDRELVGCVTEKTPPDETAVVYLLQERYQPLLRKLSKEIYNGLEWHEDCVNELFVYLKGEDLKWDKLASIKWTGAFAAWFKKTAWNYFNYIKPKMIGKIINPLSIDEENEEGKKTTLPDPAIKIYEDEERKVLLLEAISMLPDPDMKFIVLKKLQGYNSKEVAVLLQKRWKKHGIVKYNNKKEIVVPNDAYINLRLQRTKIILMDIINKLT